MHVGINKNPRWLSAPGLKSSMLHRGAVDDGMMQIWKRAPNLQQRLMQESEASGAPVYSFSGTACLCQYACFAPIRSVDVPDCWSFFCGSTSETEVLSTHLTRQTTTGSDPECCKVMHVHAD